MRRLRQVGLLLVCGLFALSPLPVEAQGTGFPDVPESHPDAWAIEELRSMYAVSGFEDGTYRPEVTATRAGVVKLAIQASGRVRYLLGTGEVPAYKDVPATDPNSGFIERAVREGIITPGEDKLFRPQASATRAEALKLVLTSFGITPPGVSGSPFTDVPPDSWEASYATFAAETGLLRINGSAFQPTRPIRRGELARIAATVLRARQDAGRPVFPTTGLVLLILGWLAYALPLAFRARAIASVPYRILAMVGAAILGPFGALGLLVARIFAHTRLGRDPGTVRPLRRRRTATWMHTIVGWFDASLGEFVGLAAVGAYLIVLVAALDVVRTTVELRSSITPLLHG